MNVGRKEVGRKAFFSKHLSLSNSFPALNCLVFAQQQQGWWAGVYRQASQK